MVRCSGAQGFWAQTYVHPNLKLKTKTSRACGLYMCGLESWMSEKNHPRAHPLRRICLHAVSTSERFVSFLYIFFSSFYNWAATEAYTTVTPDPSHICDLYRSLGQVQILNPLSEARNWTHILREHRDYVGFLTHWDTRGTPRKIWKSNLLSFRRPEVGKWRHSVKGIV